jgi:hypothetical protein
MKSWKSSRTSSQLISAEKQEHQHVTARRGGHQRLLWVDGFDDGVRAGT